MKEYYKLCFVRNSRYFSVTCLGQFFYDTEYESECPKGSVLEYKVGEKTKPKKGCGPLAVFRSISGAEFFIDPWIELDSSSFVILKGIGRKSKLDYMKVPNRIFTKRDIPDGTVLVSSFTPKEVIQWNP